MNECKPVLAGWNTGSVTSMSSMFKGAAAFAQDITGRGLHSFTFQLNVSTLYGIGGASRGCLGVV